MARTVRTRKKTTSTRTTETPPIPRTREEPFQYIIPITKEDEQVISARKTSVNQIREKSKKNKIDRQNRRFLEEQEHQWQEQLEQGRRQHQQEQQRHRPLTVMGPFNNLTYSSPTPRTREEPFQYIIPITKEDEQVISARKTSVNQVNQDNI
ncbi:hypothetical protein Glove_213g20 [Diversispora epigaea]|uniref:Uncharacterized protein n=1 Tax=Diversispora epigaea TaxID=1348612 RepID=A0A397II31_9GLOM|nr:hypothetical protein Glove_213g20 [Diversispora epigaea]